VDSGVASAEGGGGEGLEKKGTSRKVFPIFFVKERQVTWGEGGGNSVAKGIGLHKIKKRNQVSYQRNIKQFFQHGGKRGLTPEDKISTLVGGPGIQKEGGNSKGFGARKLRKVREPIFQTDLKKDSALQEYHHSIDITRKQLNVGKRGGTKQHREGHGGAPDGWEGFLDSRGKLCSA